MIDLHVHPNYSIDAEGSIIEFCEEAIDKNLEIICFTTHLDTGPGRKDCFVRVKGAKVHVLSNEWLQDYESTIKLADETYHELKVLLGVEVDLYPGVEQNLPDGFHDTDFDLIIGSVHLMDGNAISLEDEAYEIFKKHELQDLGERYYTLLIDSVETGMYDILGHIDIYRRYGEKFYGQSIHSIWKPYIRKLVKKMKKYDVGFEINTSTWRKGLAHPMPERALIQELANLGVDIVTIGSDAHSPSQVGDNIDRAIVLASQCGIKEITVFERRQPCKCEI
jgi:histidinol-phosphatase (PHP family)